ncbi:MAG: hypothetical protein ABEH77_04410, partial [Halobacteriaceae archaeon]
MAQVSRSSGGAGAKARAVAVAFGVVLGAAVIIALSALASAIGIQPGPVGQLFLSLVSLQGIAFPAVAYLYLRWRGLGLSFVPVRVPTRRELLVVAAGYVGVFLLTF